MDNRQEHLNNLSEIRQLMERSSSFISLSGLSGISAGVIGLIMAFLMNEKIGSYLKFSYDIVLKPEKRSEIIIYTVILSAIGIIAVFLLTSFFTARKAKKKGLSVWDGSAKRMLISLFIPLTGGGIFCIILLYHHFDFIILPSMLIFYGLALLNAGKYTLNEIKWLGISEIILGLAALFFLDYAIEFWAAGFGLVNIIYGLLMYFRHEK